VPYSPPPRLTSADLGFAEGRRIGQLEARNAPPLDPNNRPRPRPLLSKAFEDGRAAGLSEGRTGVVARDLYTPSQLGETQSPQVERHTFGGPPSSRRLPRHS
jgi:hypothetical protein